MATMPPSRLALSTVRGAVMVAMMSVPTRSSRFVHGVGWLRKSLQMRIG